MSECQCFVFIGR